MSVCDKCGKPVAKRESATWLSVIAGEMHPIGLFIHSDRHIKCSPSRAQHIESLCVIDDRPEFDKRLMGDEERMKMSRYWNIAFERLQDECDREEATK